MIRHNEEYRIEYRDSAIEGTGKVILKHLINGPEELNGKGRTFAIITLNPGCSIGFHKHEGDSELYYILKGTAEYNENGEIRTVKAGDLTICPEGEGHGMTNHSDEAVEFVALIPYKD